MRKCKECGNDFEPYQWNQKNCYDCLERLDPRFKGRPKRNCKNCNAEFQPRVIRQMNCSSECGEQTRVNRYYERIYGITREDYEKMLEDSGHKCNICGSEGFLMNSTKHKTKLVVDHCHDNGDIRGVLCHNCNRALGLLQDDTEIIKSALQYLINSRNK